MAAPAAVRIPALDVESPLVALAVDGEGVLVPPETADVAGWYAGARRRVRRGPPWSPGTSTRTSGRVFADRARLRPGDRVEIDRADGGVTASTVRHVQQVAKSAFPTSQVYGPTTGPQLRLITCGGEFDGDHQERRPL